MVGTFNVQKFKEMPSVKILPVPSSVRTGCLYRSTGNYYILILKTILM